MASKNAKGGSGSRGQSARRRNAKGQFVKGGGGGSRGGSTRGASSRSASTGRAPAKRATAGTGRGGGSSRSSGGGNRGGSSRGGGTRNGRTTALAPRAPSVALQNPPRGGESAGQVLATGVISAFLISLKMRALEGAPPIVDAGSDIGLGFLLRTETASKTPWAGEYMHLAGNFFLFLGSYKFVRIVGGGWVDKATAAIPVPKLLNNGATDATDQNVTDDSNLSEYVNIPGIDFNGYPDLSPVNDLTQ